MGLVTSIAAEITAYTYAFLVNRCLGRPQGQVKEMWAWDPCNTYLGHRLSDFGAAAKNEGCERVDLVLEPGHPALIARLASDAE